MIKDIFLVILIGLVLFLIFRLFEIKKGALLFKEDCKKLLETAVQEASSKTLEQDLKLLSDVTNAAFSYIRSEKDFHDFQADCINLGKKYGLKFVVKEINENEEENKNE